MQKVFTVQYWICWHPKTLASARGVNRRQEIHAASCRIVAKCL